jgi:hypothetical protein
MGGAPASVDKQSLDVALQPAAFEPGELMMVGATWRQASVRSQALEGPGHTAPTVSLALGVVHCHIRQSGGCRLALDRYAIYQSESPPGRTGLFRRGAALAAAVAFSSGGRGLWLFYPICP